MRVLQHPIERQGRHIGVGYEPIAVVSALAGNVHDLAQSSELRFTLANLRHHHTRQPISSDESGVPRGATNARALSSVYSNIRFA